MSSIEQPSTAPCVAEGRPCDASSERDEALIQLLASGKSVTFAAASVGVSGATVYRRLRDPRFTTRLAEVRAQYLRPLCETTCNAATGAMERIIEMSMNPKVHAATRLRANIAIVEMAVKLPEQVDKAARFAALDCYLEELESQRPDSRYPTPAVIDLPITNEPSFAVGTGERQ